MKKAINRLLLVWQLGVVMLFVGLTSYKLLTPPSVIEAQVASSTLGSIFSGRFIPAFIGQAYDPSEAYAAMTGLPVYVVAFQSWRGGAIGGNTTWVTGDLAIRTQIRADGTFQVMGLPEEAYYGVYFPYKWNSATLNIGTNNFKDHSVRTDCTNFSTSNGTASRHLFDGTDPTDNAVADTDRNPCKVYDKDKYISFRMPLPMDKIQDVFSYAAFYEVSEDNIGTPLLLDSQIESPINQTPVEYERIALEHVFVTNRQDVDVANNINTFPLVPTSTLKVNLATEKLLNPVGAKLDVWAVRVTMGIPFTTDPRSPRYFSVINSPIIRGRATFIGNEPSWGKFTFQAYAPPGDYVVVAWRNEDGGLGYSGSPSYKDWNGTTDLSSRLTGVGQLAVRLWDEPTDRIAHDWRGRLKQVDVGTNFIELFYDANAMWGVVTDTDGELMFDAGPGFGGGNLPRNRQAYLKAEQSNKCDKDPIDKGEELFAPRGDITAAANRFDKRSDYVDAWAYPSTANSVVPGTDWFSNHIYSNPNVKTDHGEINNSILAVRGIYLVMAVRGRGTTPASVDQCADSKGPHTDNIQVYLNTMANHDVPTAELAMLSTDKVESGFRSTLQGPIRKDVKIKKSDRAAQEIQSNVAVNEMTAGGVESGIFVRLQYPSGAPASGVKLYCMNIDGSSPCEGKRYMTDEMGQAVIPAGDLRNKTVRRYEDQNFLISGRAPGGAYKFESYIGPGTHTVLGVTQPNIRWVPPYTTIPNRKAEADSVNEGLAVVCVQPGNAFDKNVCDTPLSLTTNEEPQRYPDKYNLAILNGIERSLGLNVNATPAGFYDVSAQIVGWDQMKTVSEVNTDFYYVDTGSFVQCNKCAAILDPTSNLVPDGDDKANLNVAGFDGKFTVRVPLDAGISIESYTLKIEIVYADKTRLKDSRIITLKDGVLVTDDPLLFNLKDDCNIIAQNAALDETGKEAGWLDISAGIKKNYVEATCSIGKWVGDKIGSVFGMIKEYGLNTRALTQDKIVVKLYDIVRNVANILFVAIFIIMAFMTVLRYQPEQWHTRVILPKLLIALVLANFSLSIVQLVLDLNNFATNALFAFTTNAIDGFAQGAGSMEASGTGEAFIGASAGIVGVLSGMAVQMAMGLLTVIGATGGSALIVIALTVACMLLIAMVQLILLWMAFLSRYVIIWMAVILGPFIFMISVLPWFSDLRSKWFSYVMKVSVIQTQVAALLCIGILIMAINGNADTIIAKLTSIVIFMVMMGMALKIPKQAMSQLGINIPEFTAETAKGIRSSLESGTMTRRKNSAQFNKQLELDTATDQARIDAMAPGKDKDAAQAKLDKYRSSRRRNNTLRSFRNSTAGFVADKAMGGLGSEYREYYRKEVEEDTSKQKAKAAGESRAVDLMTTPVIDALKDDTGGKTNMTFPMGRNILLLADRIKKTGGNTMVAGADGRGIPQLTFAKLGQYIESLDPDGKKYDIRRTDLNDYKGLARALNKIEQNKDLRKEIQDAYEAEIGQKIDLSGILVAQAGSAGRNLRNTTEEAIKKLDIK